MLNSKLLIYRGNKGLLDPCLGHGRAGVKHFYYWTRDTYCFFIAQGIVQKIALCLLTKQISVTPVTFSIPRKGIPGDTHSVSYLYPMWVIFRNQLCFVMLSGAMGAPVQIRA